jgi:hypothetical protein
MKQMLMVSGPTAPRQTALIAVSELAVANTVAASTILNIAGCDSTGVG